ncbi:MAG: CPBP family intramembrane metalloprotease [Candidatus Heimdallarchaeota archaeon]|nr:MAG: CPBP family intramembrane metalloprotease [Candidatus Heimdallarchaeota archaeon]
MKKLSVQDLWTRVILFFAICVILIFSFQIFALRIAREILNNGNPFPSILEINIVRAINGVVGIGLVYVFLQFDRQKLDSAGFSWNRELGWEWILVSIPITIAGLIPTVLIEWFFDIIIIPSEIVENPALLLDPIGIILTFIVTIFCIALGEEILFRGYLQTILETQYSFLFAAVVSALLFGLLHFFLLAPGGDLEDMFAILFSAFAIGLTFSYAFKTTKYNLILPVAIHGVWDFLIFLFQAEFEYEDFFAASMEILASIVGAVIIFILIYFYTNKRLALVMTDEDESFE